MAAVNFPDPVSQNPATGEPYANGWYNDPATGGNGVTYQYTNGVWRAVTSPSDALDDRYVEVAGDTMTGALSINDEIILNTDGTASFGDSITVDGNLLIDNSGERKAVINGTTGSASFAIDNGSAGVTIGADGSGVFATDVQMASQNSGPLAGFRNQIINGAMLICQRSTSASTAADEYLSADRWKRQSAGGSVNTTFDLFNSPYPGFTRALRVVSTDNTKSRLRQAIELDVAGKAGRFVGQWTLSYYASDNNNGEPEIGFADDTNNGNAILWSSEPVVDLGNNRFSKTYTAVAPNNSNACVLISFRPSGTDWNITGVQLEPGPVATPFEHRPIGTELALCQRYYQKFTSKFNWHLVVAYGSSTQLNSTSMVLPVEMRTTPSSTITGPQMIPKLRTNGSTASGSTTSSGIVKTSNKLFWLKVDGTGYDTTQDSFIYVDKATDLSFDAEL